MKRFLGLLFIFLTLFSTLSMEADSYFSGEIYGKAYGFPILWHGNGSSSLARVVYIPGLILSTLFYLSISFVLLVFLEKSTCRIKLKKYTKIIALCAIGIFSLITSVFFLAHFIHPEINAFSDTLGDSFSHRKLHIGTNFE